MRFEIDNQTATVTENGLSLFYRVINMAFSDGFTCENDFASKEAAFEYAAMIWDHLTDKEKMRNTVQVVCVNPDNKDIDITIDDDIIFLNGYNSIWENGHDISKMYMNIATGSVDNYDGWFYENEDGETLNAVDENKVVEVEKINGDWVEVE